MHHTPAPNRTPALPADTRIAFIGGGNMASAIIGGLLRHGLPASRVSVVEPLPEARDRLQQTLGVHALAEADATLAAHDVLVWAIKPQNFAAAAQAVAPHLGTGGAQHAGALHLSVMAGIRCADVQAATGGARVVRCMPNTPALIGQGISGVFATPAAQGARDLAEAVLRPTGQVLWVDDEAQLDAVTALSGSGPAYVFYFLEAMQQAGAALGLAPEQARALAVATFAGSAQLAAQSDEPLATLRAQVTSKGGTTHAAITVLQNADVQRHFADAMRAAAARAKQLADAFGQPPAAHE